MFVLGWHGGIRREWQDMAPGWSTHDGAAVLLEDGQVVAAIEEERLNRVKHSNFFPAMAIRRCLDLRGIDLAEVDLVAMNFEERTRQIFPADLGLPSTNLYLDDPSEPSSTVRELLVELFRRELDRDVSGKLVFCNHHVAHLWSAWGMSGVDRGLVLSLDGSGDALSGMVGLGAHGTLTPIRRYSVDQSLGNLYSDSIRFLGYRRFDEYKAMGLAPYGDPARFRDLFRQCYRLLADGDYQLADRQERWGLIHDAGILPMARRAEEPFGEVHRDFAAALQEALETIVFHVVNYFARETGMPNLCYAGGVAHNCTLNGKLLYSGLFDAVFVQPAAHDAGGALGAALYAEHTRGRRHSMPLTNLYFGTDVPAAGQIEATLKAWSPFLTFEKLTDVPRATAELLAGGAVVGWVQGRSEFGPRALGHRSILADPRPATNKDRINEAVKKRESFRPFAPSVLLERLDEIFDLPGSRADYSFMTCSLLVREPFRASLGAVTHIDGTSRLQTVSREHDPLYWRLIHEFGTLTGIPAVLNTSFNNNSEPIVDSVEDAVVCFLTTEIDYLVIGDLLVEKKAMNTDDPLLDLRPSMPASRKLVRRSRPDAHFSVELTASRHFGHTSISVRKETYDVLAHADGTAALRDLLGQRGIAGSRHADVTRELRMLWERRAVMLRP